MRYRAVGLTIALLALSLTVYGWHAAQAAPADLATVDQMPPIPPEEEPEGSEVLTRGPVNEAFAAPVSLQLESGVVAPHRPPASIEEVPPVDRPQDDRYAWVPGYWSWDDDRNDFIWVSACWRLAPPNRYWVPGYWTQVSDGWEWVAGFWTQYGPRQIEYLPAPPAPVEIEPPGPPPFRESMWVPGCWYWNANRYVRRPGYWLRGQPGWIWEPSHYTWSPRGYVFVAGHWDYALEERGVLFAPVYFPPTVYGRMGFSYSPSISINIGMLSVNMFTYPRYSHYYFGDYYDDVYIRLGIFPRFEAERRHTWYDPLYAHDRWHGRRSDPRWGERQREDYDRRRGDRGLRPARTYREQETRMARLPEPQQINIQLAMPLKTAVARQASPMKFERISNETRQNTARRGFEANKFRDQRARWETPAGSPPEVQPPGDRKETVDRPRQPREPAPTPAPGETRGQPGARDNAPRPVSPREVRLTKPELVDIPPPPVVDRPDAKAGKAQTAPPRTPAREGRQTPGQQKGKQKKEAKKG